MRNSTIPHSSPMAAWMLDYYGYTFPEEGMRQLALMTLDQAKQTNPPIRLEALFPHRKVLKVVYKEIASDAALRVEESGFVIEVKPKRPETRTRFSIAHELGHTYFFDIGSRPPRRACAIRFGSPDEERLCDIAAAELLMPGYLLREGVSTMPCPGQPHFSMHIFQFLLEAFLVSVEALARRLVRDLSLWNSVIIGCRWLPKAGAPGAEMEQRVSDGWRAAWYVVPAHVRDCLYLPPANKRPRVHLPIVERAYRARKVQEGKEEVAKFRLGSSKLIPNSSDEARIAYALPIVPQGLQLPLPSEPNKAMGYAECEDTMLRRQSDIIVCIPLHR